MKVVKIVCSSNESENIGFYLYLPTEKEIRQYLIQKPAFVTYNRFTKSRTQHINTGITFITLTVRVRGYPTTLHSFRKQMNT